MRLHVSFSRQRDEPKVSDSGATSDEENEDGDFTVYECPGLAPVSKLPVALCIKGTINNS